MGVYIDEKIIEPELVFNQNGFKLYRYNKPLYVYFEGADNYIVYASRKDKWDRVTKLCKTPCFYRLFCTDEFIKKIYDDNYWKITMRKDVCELELWDKSYFSELMEQLKLTFGEFLFDSSLKLDQYYNCKIKPSYPNDISFKDILVCKSDFVEVTKLNKHERQRELVKKKAMLLDKFFGKQVKQISDRYKGWFSAVGCCFRISSLKDESREKALEELKQLGLKTRVENRCFGEEIVVELPDDLLKGESNA